MPLVSGELAVAARKASKTNCILRGFNLVVGMFKVEEDRADALVRFERNKSSGKRFDATREIKGKETAVGERDPG